jgi:hypothetical protein
VDKRLVTPTLERVDWRSPPAGVTMPSLDELGAMSTEDLAAWAERWGIYGAWPTLRAESVAYLSKRGTALPGTEEFAEGLRALVDGDSRRFLLGANRRVLREYQTLDALSGEQGVGQKLIRVTEGDDHVCDGCEPLGGMVGTIEEHEAEGLPGSASCLGGEYCRCTLVPIG